MNCENCGAPLALVEGRDYYTCHYCCTFHFPEALSDSADGVKPLNEHVELQCPVCALTLSAGSLEGYRVDYCARCRGVYAANDDFGEIVRRKRRSFKGPAADPVALDQEALKRNIKCPTCDRMMDTHPYYGPGAVVIDTCGKCRTVWLDHGEIAAIETAPGRRW